MQRSDEHLRGILTTLGPVGVALLGLGVGTLQAEQARQECVKLTNTEFLKYLPQVAEEQWQPIHDAVKECFDAYERSVRKRVNEDSKSRQAELDNLLEQKESRELTRETERKRLKRIENEVYSSVRNVEADL